MSDDFIPGITSANTRRSKVQRFIAKPPKGAAMLVLIAATDDGEAQLPLAQWQKDEVLAEHADEVLQALDDHAQEMGGHVTASLSWLDDAAKVQTTLPLKRQRNHVLDDARETAQGLNAQLTGDARSLVQHSSVQLERMSKVYIAGIASVLVHSERIVMRQAEMLETLAERLGRAESRADEKEAELQELLDFVRAEQAKGNDAPSPAVERALRLLESVAPHLLRQLMQNGKQPAQAEAAE